MATVFISYARKDGRGLADRIAANLERMDHTPWLDRSEIRGGNDWSRAIEDAIDACDVFVAILTHGSFDSTICRNEQARALRQEKPVVPLLGQADADRPVYLELAHYLDFSDLGQFEQRFADLERQIGSGEGLRVGDLPSRMRASLNADRPLATIAAAVGGRSVDWPEIRSLASTSRRQFLDVVTTRGTGPGVFEEDLFVVRTEIDDELARFLSSDAQGLVLLGNSGVGKTSLLSHWAGEQVGAGHAVFMYHAAKLRSSDITAELMRDLRLEDPNEFQPALSLIDDLARADGRHLIVIVDGINEFRGRSTERVRDLLEEIDTLIAELPGENVRVVLSCSTPAWTRIDRRGEVRLSSNRYHSTVDDQPVLILGRFTEEEAGRAYELYRERFDLRLARDELPAALRARLHDPLLLRFFASSDSEAKSVNELLTDGHIFRRYFQDRIRRREDRRFLVDLAGEMRRVEQAALTVTGLRNHETFREAVGDGDAESSYRRLVDDGVLVELQGDDPLFDDDVVQFAYPMIGAYALARLELQADRPVGTSVQDLVRLSEKIPFAWDGAEAVLLEQADDELFRQLAQSEDIELREVSIEALTTMASSSQDRAQAILDSLLGGDSMLGHRSALRAAYAIGPASRELFMRAAMSRSEDLRQAVRDTLYLIWTGTARARGGPSASDAYFLWRQAPDFTYGLIGELVSRLTWLRPREAYRIALFVLDLLITIYINHCDRRDVTEKTAEIFRELTVGRLHFDRLRLGSHLESLVLKLVYGVFSRRVLSWILVGDEADAPLFFRRSMEERGILKEIAPLLDPEASLDSAEDQLRLALDSGVEVFAGGAALALAVHAHADFDGSEPTLRRLFDQLGPEGKVWQLIGLSVLLPTAPNEWVPLLENFTATLLEEDPDIARSRRGILSRFELFLVPLGLAYGRRGGGMPLFDRLLENGFASPELATRTGHLIAGLGPVGFYYPKEILHTLRKHADRIQSSPECVEGLVTALGTVRRLHVDVVDAFMLQLGMDQPVQRRVVAAGDSQQIHRFVHLLGYYNNAVHYCLSYPKMRRGLGMSALELLADAREADEFVIRYGQQGLRMAREADFDLLEWTRP